MLLEDRLDGAVEIERDNRRWRRRRGCGRLRYGLTLGRPCWAFCAPHRRAYRRRSDDRKRDTQLPTHQILRRCARRGTTAAPISMDPFGVESIGTHDMALPSIVAGPILRRAAEDQVSVWLATTFDPAPGLH